jgi:hypothetical protein
MVNLAIDCQARESINKRMTQATTIMCSGRATKAEGKRVGRTSRPGGNWVPKTSGGRIIVYN